MSEKIKKSKTVFVEGSAVTTTSPYDQFELSYKDDDSASPTLPTVPKEKRTIRLECLQLAVLSESGSQKTEVESVINLAKRYYQFVKTGE